jgi:hypothetical protein
MPAAAMKIQMVSLAPPIEAAHPTGPAAASRVKFPRRRAPVRPTSLSSCPLFLFDGNKRL